MNKKKKRKRKSNWTPPRNYTDFFSPEADQEFKRRHPIGYPALVMLGMVALLLPACLFCVLVDGPPRGRPARARPGRRPRSSRRRRLRSSGVPA